MKEILMYLLALEVRKWDVDSRKINFTAYTVADEQEFRLLFTVSITTPQDMIEELLGKIKKINKEKLNKLYDSSTFDVVYSNEHFLRQKLFNYFKRIIFELTNPKKKKSQRGIVTIRYDIFNENQDISFLPTNIQFFVFLNWARKYYEREQYIKVLEPLKKALEINPNYNSGYKWMGRSLMKLRRFPEAQKYFEKYAELEGTYEAYLQLAHCYRKTFMYEAAEKLYQEILKHNPDNFDALMGLAQISYTLNKPYEKILDQLYEKNPDHVRQWIKTDWDFRIVLPKKTRMSALQAASYLGFPNVFELSTKAFKNEVPGHFNSVLARLVFYKEELDQWAHILNKYQCVNPPVQLNERILSGVTLPLVEVSVLPNGVHLPVDEVQEKEGEEFVEPVTEQISKKMPDVEEIIARFNKKAVLHKENEAEIFNSIAENSQRRAGRGRKKKKLPQQQVLPLDIDQEKESPENPSIEESASELSEQHSSGANPEVSTESEVKQTGSASGENGEKPKRRRGRPRKKDAKPSE